MSNSSESALQIINQPKDFCTRIDLIIEELNNYSKKIETIYELSDTSIYKKIELCKTHTPSDCKSDNFNNMISEMKCWFNCWLSIFDDGISKEKDELFKNQLVSEYIFFESELKSFENRTEYFKLTHEKLIEIYETTLSDFNKEVEGNSISKSRTPVELDMLLYSFSSNVDDSISNIINNYEYLRFSNSNFRDYINEELKEMTKVQLTRNKNTKWMSFLEEDRNIDKKANFVSLSKKSYLIKTKRETY